MESGKTARLDCAATGDPRPQMSWQKDGGNNFPAAIERRMHVMPADDAFYIINAKITDQGIYTCTAESSVGIITANATLIVNGNLFNNNYFNLCIYLYFLFLFFLEPPSFVKPMENKDVINGKSIVLECMASGSPKPHLRWLKDNQTIDTTERHFFAAENQLLIIVDAKFSDSGNYKCEIRNELGIETGYMNLTVNPIIITHTFNFRDMMGVIIITVFCCAVVTSIVWVIIIYQAKKRNINNNSNTNNNTTKFQQYYCPPQVNETSFNSINIPTNIYETHNNSSTTPPPPTSLTHYIIENNRIDEENENDETDPLKSIIESDRNSPVIIMKKSNSRDIFFTQQKYPQQPPPSPINSINQSQNYITSTPLYNNGSYDDHRINDIDDVESQIVNHNLHENKLNKLENLLNSNSNGGVNTNNKMSCISICSLDSIHSLKQSL